MTEFAALRPKTYSYLMDDGNSDKKHGWKVSKYGPEMTPSLDTFHAVKATGTKRMCNKRNT